MFGWIKQTAAEECSNLSAAECREKKFSLLKLLVLQIFTANFNT